MASFFSKASVVVLVIALLAYKVHHAIPEDCEDFTVSQICSDLLYAFDSLGNVLEMFSITRWYSFYTVAYLASYANPSISDLNVSFTTFAGVRSVVIKPKGNENADLSPAVVFYHGGGWCIGDIDSYINVLSDMVRETGYVVMSPEYRLAPQHPFPTPYEDCLNSTLEFMSRSEEFNFDPNRVVLAGDSAGGNLALSITNTLVKMNKENSEITLPVMQALVYPAVQMINFHLDSYQHDFGGYPTLSNLLIYKFYLSYIGFGDRFELASLLANNEHVDVTDPQVAEKLKWINNDVIRKKHMLKKGKEVERVKHGVEITPALQAQLKEIVFDSRISPVMENSDILSQLPRTHVLVCGYDQLRDDGLLLVDLLEKLEVDVTLQYLPRSLHGAFSFGAEQKPSYHNDQNNIFFNTIKHYVDGL